ncbi:hypothetical protein PVAND_008739 [Polypedilum vanderplanki]|uniref:chitinase n=1 Tax=Polypedilum vanderplanki TaxID=319348 RepID=A0A9J6CAK0_POLVA|nr:hypothetical protein PVAND_008739 [Polypedilum vanderplanki]
MRLIHNGLGILVAFLAASFINNAASEPRVVCYYTNWSVYRPGTAKFNPQNINPYLCTHLIYAFGGFTKDNQLKPFDKYQDIEQGGYAKFTGLKTYNKELKTMLAIGGWNEGSTRFSPLVASADRRAQLVKNTIKFLRQNKFDGLDLDWEYPAFRDGGKAKDRENYAKLVQELREEFDREHQKTGRPRLLLTMAVPAGFEYIDKGYDVPKLNKYLDWFNLLSYDYHSAYEPAVNHHAPLYPIEEENEYSFDNDLNINATINYYIKSGADRDKLVLGIPTYGRSYTLFNPESNEIGAPADGPGDQGDATREKGYLAYYEICQSLKEPDSTWTVVQPNPEALGPYAYSENQWVGYDDEEIVRRKSEFVVEQKLGGIMFWSIDNDDFRGLCNNKPYPLIEAAKESYLDGLENGVQRKSLSGANKRKQTTTTTRKPDSKKSGKTTTPAPPTTPTSGSDFKCEEEGFYPHPSDCAKYFWCLEAPGLGIVAHHFSCPSGLLFNKQADSCDYARNVYCTTKKATTTTEAAPVWTTTVKTTTTTSEKPIYNKVSSIYKAPSRTTTTTTLSPAIDIDSSDLEQEDPKVIKELIELIKKAGGIEELEKQISIQEDNSNSGGKSSATTPATLINKTLVDKFKNRASLFKTRPIFNGASQAERKTVEQKTSSTSTQKAIASSSSSSDEKSSSVAKKYNSINRFSRPEPQNTGVDEIPQDDAVLIEKPQYTSIQRRRPVKPEVIAENDYNNDSDRSNENTSKLSSVREDEVSKKYTSITRQRKPVVTEVVESEEDEDEDEIEDEEEEEEITTKSTTVATKAPTKYINLSRRRSTTAAPDEKPQQQEEKIEAVQASTQSSSSFRRRVTTTVVPTSSAVTQAAVAVTEKTVLTLDNNSDNQILPRFSLDNTLFKREQDSLNVNRHLHDDDDDINHIALPTESITENLPIPDTTITITTTTQFPSLSLSSQINNANNEQVNESATESVTDSSVDDIDLTTIINDNDDEIIENGLSKNNVNIQKTNFFAPRPFARTKPSPSSTISTSSLSPTRNFPSRKNFNSKSDIIDNETSPTKTIRRRPTVTRTFASTTESSDEEDEAPRTRPTYSYRPGYRGTARFRYSTSKTGEYDKSRLEGNYQPIDDNRLRSLNLERANNRPATTATTERTTIEDRTTTRRRPFATRTQAVSKTSTQAPESNEETTTEYRIIEAKNRFNLNEGERPDRIRFELSAGGKINFGSSFTKAKEKPTLATKEPDSKVKVITGPLDKSPLIESGRLYKKGHVEEIPIQKEPESVTVQSHSNKLDLSEIPLNKSDIASFVSNDDLKSDETTKRPRLKPSVVGFKKRIENEEEPSTTASIEEIETTTKTRSRLRPSQSRFAQREQARIEGEVKDELSEEISSKKILTRNRISQRGRERSDSSEREFVRKSQITPDQNDRSETASPKSFQSRFSGRTRAQVAKEINSLQESTASEELTTKSYLTRVKASDLFLKNRKSNAVADSENSESQNNFEETSTLRERFRPNKNRFVTQESSTDFDIQDLVTDRPSFEENEIDFTTIENSEEETTENSLLEASSHLPPKRLTIRKRPAKKINFTATRQTITESGNDIGKEIENTSSSIFTSESDDDEIYETEIETATDEKKFETTTTENILVPASKPTRRVLVTRKRVSTEKPAEEEEQSAEREPVIPRTTTRKRVIAIKTKTGVIKQTVELGNYETTEPSTEAPVDESAKIEDSDVIRKRIKVYRSRATTERIVEESSTHKPIYTRTKIYRRPVKTEDETSEASVDTSTSERIRTSPRRRIVKVTRRPTQAAAIVTEETENERVESEEPIIESSSIAPKKVFKKILRTKTPRVIADRPLEEDSLVIKSEDEIQQIDQANEEKGDENNEENVEVSSEEPSSRPLLKYPTRPNGRVQSVTIRKRPAFAQTSRTSTVHPASTRFGGANITPTRTKQVTRKRYRPSSSVSTEAAIVDEIDNEKRIELGEKRKKIFSAKGGNYRKTSSTTNAPNITPHTDTESEINEYDDEDTTDISQTNINNDGILQNKPRFSLNRYKTSTTPKPTTLHHVFAIDEDEETQKARNGTSQAENADEVIKKLQKLIEINRIVEVYSKEEKLKLLKNKKLKSIKAGELTVEKPPVVDKFGEISRHVVIKLAKPAVNVTVNATTESPEESRSAKSIMFAETVFGKAETSTISLEGLFEREKKELEQKDEKKVEISSASQLNEKKPIVISIANLDQVILSKVQRTSNGDGSEDTTTENSVDEETTTLARPTVGPTSVRKNQARVTIRARNPLTSRRTTDATTLPATTTSVKTSPVFLTTNRPRTTRIVRKRITNTATTPGKTVTVSTTPQTTIPSTTTTSLSKTSRFPVIEQFSNELDDEVASILPALTSVRPRKAPQPVTVINSDIATHRALKTIPITPIQIETSSIKSIPTTTFDKILEHQYKIKGLDVDFEEEKVEEEEKLIGVLGSQVKVVLHSVSADPEKTKIECLEHGNYPHPLSCSMYISCARNRGFLEGYIFSCGEEMSFDPATGVCDWNYKIGCTRNNVKILHN